MDSQNLIGWVLHNSKFETNCHCEEAKFILRSVQGDEAISVLSFYVVDKDRVIFILVQWG
jgi:hypothetical protein